MMPKPATRTLFALLAMQCLLLPACRAVQMPMGYTGGNTYSDLETREGDAEAEAGIWPARWGNNPNNRGVMISLDPLSQLRAVHYARHHQGRSTPGDYEDAATLAAALGIENGFKFKVEGPGSLIFMEPFGNNQPRKDPPDLAFKYVSARQTTPDDGSADAELDHIELERTWFTFRNPRSDRETLGTMVLLPGMFGTPEPIVDAAERFWHNRGYAVLRMLSHPSRFTQHLMMTYFEGRTDAIAQRVADAADQRIAETAYAVAAALDHSFAQNRALDDHPVVLLGMSGGAMALPSVYAHDPDRYDAAVLIAGGANFLRIMIESNYRDWIDAVLVDFDPLSDDLGEPEPGVVDALAERYLELANLDAYHTAPQMQALPVLILHATNDRAVPASTGDLLYERLGRPERWTYPMGHELIFAALPTQIPRIDKWLSTQLQPDDEPEE